MLNFIRQHRLAIISIALFFISLNIYSANIKSRNDLNGFQRLIVDITMPVQNLTGNITSSFYNTIDSYIFLVNAKNKNIKLKKDVNKLNARIEELKELEIANDRLRGLLDFKKTLKNKVVSAEVVSRGPSNWLNTIIIDKGENDGIFPGLAVITENGIVGHTIYTSNNYSQILLMVDKNSSVDIIDQRSRAQGIVKGSKDNLCKVDYVLSKEDVKVDDIIISSGLDGIYPKGLLVGQIQDVTKNRYDLFQKVTLKPFVDFDKLEEVLIIIREKELLEEIQQITENKEL